MVALDDAATYARRPGLEAVDMDGELVMMGLDQGAYFGMRGTAASLWQHLAEPRTLDVLCELIAEEYEVAVETCRPDVAVFLADLLDRRLIEPVA